MKVTGKARRGLVEAVAEARDEALAEIGREAALRQKERAGKARRLRVEKVAADSFTFTKAATDTGPA